MADSAPDLVDNAATTGPLPRSRAIWDPPSPTVEEGGTVQLCIEFRTWHRDSHELFDYESQHIYHGKHNVRRSARIFRNGNEVILDEENTANGVGANGQPNGDFLLSIKSRDNRFYVFPAERSSMLGPQPRKLWLITRNLPNGSYPLSEGDVIKLGRFKLRIKQIVPEHSTNVLVDYRLEDSSPYNDGTDGSPTARPRQQPQAAADDPANHGEVIQCRICLLEGTLNGDEEDRENPLVRPCQCKGSIMYVHLECLRHWVNGKLNLSEDLSRSCCFVRQIQCELCKATYPSFITSKGEKLPVVKIPQLQPPFIVLENLVGAANKGVHLCSLAVRRECKLGRGHESDVRIADVSISRWHATIKYTDGHFQLVDHGSKFGTLVALRKPVIMSGAGRSNIGGETASATQADRLSVQVGRTVMDLKVSQPGGVIPLGNGVATAVTQQPTPPPAPPASNGTNSPLERQIAPDVNMED